MMQIGQWAHHYLWGDVYGPIWPNIAASAILGVWALRRFIRLEKIHKLHTKKLEDIHNAIRNQAIGGQIRGSEQEYGRCESNTRTTQRERESGASSSVARVNRE